MLLIGIAAAVAVPGSVGSGGLSPTAPIDSALFRGVDVASAHGTAMTTSALDPNVRSEGALDADSVLFEPDRRDIPSDRPAASRTQPEASPRVVVVSAWHLDRNVSWYGPGFYGKRTACGQAMTQTLRGVAHRSLPCGTRVTFRNPANGRTITVPVVDRGPYVTGRQWDLTAGTCQALGHCYTGSLYYKLP
jgi:hypothetical protein